LTFEGPRALGVAFQAEVRLHAPSMATSTPQELANARADLRTLKEASDPPRLSGRWIARVLLAHLRDGLALEEVAQVVGVTVADLRRWLGAGLLGMIIGKQTRSDAKALSSIRAELHGLSGPARRRQVVAEIETISGLDITKVDVYDLLLVSKATYHRWLLRDEDLQADRAEPAPRLARIPSAKRAPLRLLDRGILLVEKGSHRHLVHLAVDRYCGYVENAVIVQAPLSELTFTGLPESENSYVSRDVPPPRLLAAVAKRFIGQLQHAGWRVTPQPAAATEHGGLRLLLSPMDPALVGLVEATDLIAQDQALIDGIRTQHNTGSKVWIGTDKRTPEGHLLKHRTATRRT
jgi:hypothetical protein